MSEQALLIEKDIYKINKPIRLIELFAGYGSQALSLKYLNVEAESILISEWAINSILAYKSLHKEYDDTDYCESMTSEEVIQELYKRSISRDYNKPLTLEQISRVGDKRNREILNAMIATNNKGSICNINGKDIILDTNYCNILTYSFPCQDLSLAGKRSGMNKESGTRSGLLWEVERILKEMPIKPDVLLMENVPQVHNVNNIADFKIWLNFLKSLGYSNYDKDLTANDYGIPQTRNRCFMVSLLGSYNYNFPEKQPLKLKLKDLLEKEVDEKYFLSKKTKDFFIQNDIKQREKGNGFRFNASRGEGVAKTITTRNGSRMDDNFIIEESIKIPEATKVGYKEAYEGDGVYINRPHLKRGVVQKDMIQTLKTSVNDIGVVVASNLKSQLCDKLIENSLVEENDIIKHSYTSQIISGNKKCVEKSDCMVTLTTRGDCFGVVVKENENYIEWKEKGKLDMECRATKENGVCSTILTIPKNKVLINNLRIRKLTPNECFRLMGVKDEDYDKLTYHSGSALYHLAGDSIVVNVLMAIFKELIN